MTAPSVHPAEPADPPRRSVWCATKSGLLHGSIKPHPEGGTIYGCEMLTLDEALAAFERFRADPGSFSIDSAADNSLIFSMRRGDRAVGMDLWLDAPYDTAAIDTDQVPALIAALYEPIDDEAVAARITALGGEMNPYRVSPLWLDALIVAALVGGLALMIWLAR